MNESLRAQVRDRAVDRCEYCQLPQSATILTHEVDHIRSQKHNGPTTLDNLCWACAWCNAFKGSDIAGLDPLDDTLTPLFHPRRQIWSAHFAWRGPLLEGHTPIGRTTILVLKINEPDRVEHRRLLIRLGILVAR